jgi:phosphoglycerate dehydrogenase-like enzyme
LRPNVVFSVKEVGQTPESLEPIFKSDFVEWVHLATTGIDHLPSWDDRGLTVTNSAGTGGSVIAEYVLAQVLARETSLLQYAELQRRRTWHIQPRRSLEGLVLHLVGVGNIGGKIATAAKAFGMIVIGFARTRANADLVDEMHPTSALCSKIGQADYVSIQVPLTDDTRNLVDSRVLSSMKRTAWLINVSRGGVVDEAALKAVLTERTIGGAVLDVFETEPLHGSDPLWQLDNIVVTPHMAGYTSDWELGSASVFCEKLARWRSGGLLQNVVRPLKAALSRNEGLSLKSRGDWP